MKFYNYVAIGALLGLIQSNQALKLVAYNRDEVDDLLDKQDAKDAQELTQKEMGDQTSKMNQIGNMSRKHSSAEDEDFMKSVFDQYATQGIDKRGNPTGMDILAKDKAYEAAKDIIVRWNDLPEQNAKKYLDERFDNNWKKIDVNNAGFIDETEAF